MTASSRFPVATHILVALHWNEGTLISSEQLAETVNTNPVVIRRVLGVIRCVWVWCYKKGLWWGTRTAPPGRVSGEVFTSH